jgi:hypothetical protein
MHLQLQRTLKVVYEIETTLWAGRSGVWFLEGAKDDSVLQNVQTVSDDHSASYTKGTLGSTLEGKTAAQ